jgi:hypothetical protein
MTLPGKRLRKYNPRRSKKVLVIQKQEFLDCLHTLDLAAGQLIVLSKEGSVSDIQHAQEKAKATYQKFKDQLLELAKDIQAPLKIRTQHYLNDYKRLIDNVLTYDENVFNAYYQSLLRLKAISCLKIKGLAQAGIRMIN